MTEFEKFKPGSGPDIVQQDQVLSNKDPRARELRDFDLSIGKRYEQLLDLIRLEPCMRHLPACENENPKVFNRVRDLLQEMISEGSLLVYSNGANIHEVRPGEMQIILGGKCQMTHNRYSKRIEELKESGFDGPEFYPGAAVGSWSMAGGTGSHFADLTAVGSAVTLSLSGSQYEKLVRLSLDFPGVATSQGIISEADVEELLLSGVVKSYTNVDSGLVFIERERDFAKRKEDHLSRIWREKNLGEADFLIKQDGEWHRYEHAIQRGIKNQTVFQHVLQKNFIFNGGEKERAPCFAPELPNESFLALVRNTHPLSGSVSASSEALSKYIYLASFKTADVEKPEKPLSTYTGELGGKIEVSLLTDGVEKKAALPIPSHGVIDPKELIGSISELDEFKNSSQLELKGIEILPGDDLALSSIDLEAYGNEIARLPKFSFKDFKRHLRSCDYIIDESIDKQLDELFESTGKSLMRESELRCSNLDYKHRASLLRLLNAWQSRDYMDHEGPDPIIFTEEKLKELTSLLGQFVELYGSEDAANKVVAKIEANPSDRPITKACLLILSEVKGEQEIDISSDARDKIYYKDLKHYEYGFVDRSLKYQFQNGAEQREITDVSVPWAQEYGRQVVCIPDRHEDFWGLVLELETLGVIENKLAQSPSLQNFNGDLYFLGDVINRNVGVNGLAALMLVDRLITEGRSLDPEKSKIRMIVGNHERDLLSWSDDEIFHRFPDLADQIVTTETRKLLREMITNGNLVAAIELSRPSRENPDNAPSICTITHSAILPDFIEAYAPNSNISDLVNMINNDLREAVKYGDYKSPIFAKSKGRGGDEEFSGPIEADMGGGSRSDIARIYATYGNDTTSRCPNQIVGHSFSTDDLNIRSAKLRGTVFPGIIIADTGDHQATTGGPNICHLVISPDGKAVSRSPILVTKPELPKTEAQVDIIYRNSQTK